VSRTTTGPTAKRWNGNILAFWRESTKKRKMEAPQPYRSWGVYLLDRACLGMMLLAVTGMIFVLASR